MFARIIALFLVAITLGGCVSIKETTTRNNDGTTTTERSVNGWVPSAPVYVAPSYGRYGRDYSYGYNGRLSYDPAIPAPNVVFGEMLSGTMRAANVNGSWRMCDIRSTAPNYCHRLMEAYGWPELAVGWRR